MPIISTFFGIVIRMFHKEHEPTHFHAERHSNGFHPWSDEAMTKWLPNVIGADYRGEYRLRVKFNDGSEKTVDFRDWLEGPVFEPLRNVVYFRRFFIDGGTVAWPNGADIAPETLYDARAVEDAA